MKKLIFGVIALVASIFISVPAQAATNDFTITSYDVNMMLGRDGERRSALQVKETITADFPMTDQNHGLERAFVKDYDGHSLSFKLESVTDQNGKGLTYHWTGDNLRIGDADTYVHGSQTYVISYSMRDVTRLYTDTEYEYNKQSDYQSEYDKWYKLYGDCGSHETFAPCPSPPIDHSSVSRSDSSKTNITTTVNEFYWDVIGTDWQVPIQEVTIHLAVDSSLRSAFNGDATCYEGTSGSTVRCNLDESDANFSVQASNLGSHEGVTIALGFKPDTFAAYQRSLLETLFIWWVIIQALAVPLGIIFLIIVIVQWYKRLNRDKEMGTIIAEYIPPKDTSVTTSARIGGYSTAINTAQMLDFAVRHYIKIYEVKAKSLFTSAQYEIEVIRDPSELLGEEQEILKDTFGSLPSVGQRMNLKELQNNTEYYKRTLNNDTDLDKLIRGEYQLRALDEPTKQWARRWARIAFIVAIPLLSFMWVLAGAVLYVLSSHAWRLTDKGLALKRYLEGLKLYISVAEKDRIKMLQSPEGAEKVESFTGGDPSADPKLLVKLYERVLPYAVLFGQEKQWNAQLGKYYETAGSQPDWYTGQTAFNAAVFSTAMSSFSSANTYASSSSSSSGGSSGGGFSAGGGGGGGGGGW